MRAESRAAINFFLSMPSTSIGDVGSASCAFRTATFKAARRSRLSAGSTIVVARDALGETKQVRFETRAIRTCAALGQSRVSLQVSLRNNSQKVASG